MTTEISHDNNNSCVYPIRYHRSACTNHDQMILNTCLIRISLGSYATGVALGVNTDLYRMTLNRSVGVKL